MSPTASRRKPKTSRVRKLRVPRSIVAPPRHPSMSDKMDAVLQEEAIQAFLETHENIAPAAINAVKLILEKNLEAPMHEVVRTLRRVIETLARRKVKVFFSYKAKDEEVAEKIANKLSSWSAEKLDIQGMQRFAEEQAGQEWRKKILTTIQECDCFLLLLPSPGEQGDERDWVLLEAGYYLRGQDLAGRLVCLHHPENEVANALDDRQSVPANNKAVRRFLTGLFHEPNWIPGWDPLNKGLEDLDARAKEIVDLIHPPVLRTCCGPHMEVKFDNPSAVKGWAQLAAGRVVDSNDECRQLFGLKLPKAELGEWFKRAQGAGKDEGWVIELVNAIQAVGDGVQIPTIRSAIKLGEHSYARPAICAIKRRKKDQFVETINLLFNETELPPETSTMNLDLAALAITLQFAVPFRYRVLKNYAGRKLSRDDVLAFNRSINELTREMSLDPRFHDRKAIQAKVIGLFTGEDKAVVENMYKRAGQMWSDNKDSMGEIDTAVAQLDAEVLAKLIDELLKMNQDFLIVTSKRFAELIAQPARH